jgi:hypothetical protein
MSLQKLVGLRPAAVIATMCLTLSAAAAPRRRRGRDGTVAAHGTAIAASGLGAEHVRAG